MNQTTQLKIIALPPKGFYTLNTTLKFNDKGFLFIFPVSYLNRDARHDFRNTAAQSDNRIRRTNLNL